MWKLLPCEIELPAFHGPLDLLLHLIEREELDISAISLAQVTEQYLSYLARLEELEAEILADFLVVAARLIWIKSRLLLPISQMGKPATNNGQSPSTLALEEAEGEDPGEALARQLRAYKRFKEAAAWLREREQRGLRAYVRITTTPKMPRRLDLGGVSAADLLLAMQRVLAEKSPLMVGDEMPPLSITIHEKISLVGRWLRTQAVVRFRSLLERAADRVEVMVTLLAVLELIKCQQVIAEQPQLFGEILIRLAPGATPDAFDVALSNGADLTPEVLL
ncbi:MAG: segregation/condensation protein A [Anaerolineae bacterium]|nr:segregation/condensation protein A [Anaerolineae bacterium]MDW8100543.1 segregation/condensation protein A [Anaerolineae bacterium]